MEYQDYLSSLCSGCHEPKAESMDPANEGEYEVVPVTCWACAARDGESRAVSERIDTPDSRKPGGLDRSSVDGTFLLVKKKGGD